MTQAEGPQLSSSCGPSVLPEPLPRAATLRQDGAPPHTSHPGDPVIEPWHVMVALTLLFLVGIPTVIIVAIVKFARRK